MSTIIQQGSFVSTGNRTVINLRSDVDWMETTNLVQMFLTPTPGRVVAAYWQRGFADGTGIETRKLDGVDTVSMSAMTSPNGFTPIDTSLQTTGPSLVLTAISNAVPPVVTTGSTASLVDGDVVRIFNTLGAQQLGGYDFTVDVLTGTTFELPYTAPIVAATTGTFRKVNNDPKYYPRVRFITGMTRGISTIVRVSVTHDYTVGQKVRFSIPSSLFGIIQLDKRIGTITSIAQDITTNTNTLTVDINSTSFPDFMLPLTANTPFTPATVIPVGEAAEEAFANNLEGATENRAILGIELGSGIAGAAGSLADTIFWRAGTSFDVNNVL